MNDPGHRISRARPSFHQAGFSLLEVVVAFAILAISLGILMEIFSRAMNTTGLSGTYSRATTLAEARLADVGLEIPLEAGTARYGEQDGLHWQVTIEPFEQADPNWLPELQPYLVTSRVAWDMAAGEREVELTSLRLGVEP